MGNAAQPLRVLPSTAGQATWAVIEQGCTPGRYTAVNCAEARAGIFRPNVSRTWESKGTYDLGLEANFGRDKIGATYGLDTVALGFSNITGGPVLANQVVAGMGTNTYYIGTFGLGREPTNFTTFEDSYPSFLTNLASKSIIPSRSWSYTAGARYRE